MKKNNKHVRRGFIFLAIWAVVCICFFIYLYFLLSATKHKQVRRLSEGCVITATVYFETPEKVTEICHSLNTSVWDDGSRIYPWETFNGCVNLKEMFMVVNDSTGVLNHEFQHLRDTHCEE